MAPPRIKGYTHPAGTDGSLEIPATLGGVPVVSIGAEAFYNDGTLTSITAQAGSQPSKYRRGGIR